MLCTAVDHYAAVRAWFSSFYKQGLTEGSLDPLRHLVQFAMHDPKFILTVVCFSTSIASGSRTCPESLHDAWRSCCALRQDNSPLPAAYTADKAQAIEAYGNGTFSWHEQYASGWFDCACGWPGRLARLLSRLLPRGNFRVHNMNKHATGPVYPLELLEQPAFLRGRGQAHVFVLDYSVHFGGAAVTRDAATRLAARMEAEMLLRKLRSLPSRPQVLAFLIDR